MQTIDELNARFAIRDHLTFHEDVAGMPFARVSGPLGDATVYLQGAHLARWSPVLLAADGGPGQRANPVFYLSPKTAIAAGKAIRGGVPVLFPWFGERWDGAGFEARTGVKSPAHGFARTAQFDVRQSHLSPDGAVHLTVALSSNSHAPMTRAVELGYDDFTLLVEFGFGRELQVTLTVSNHGQMPMVFEEGLHSYFAVEDAALAHVDGLRGSTYIDKRDDGIRKVQREPTLTFTRDVDQVHVQASDPVALRDPVAKRTVLMTKVGSGTTVVWSPWSVLTPGIADLPEGGWRHFVCVEACNAGDARVTLRPGESHGMAMTLRVEDERPHAVAAE